ncbi:MAG: hypothetical protein WCV85_02610 [Patescibacteria group bacterium]
MYFERTFVLMGAVLMAGLAVVILATAPVQVIFLSTGTPQVINGYNADSTRGLFLEVPATFSLTDSAKVWVKVEAVVREWEESHPEYRTDGTAPQMRFQTGQRDTVDRLFYHLIRK